MGFRGLFFVAAAGMIAGSAVAATPLSPQEAAKRARIKERTSHKVPLPVQGPPEKFMEPPKDKIPELWFPVGEKLTFGIWWGIVPVGQAVAWTEWVEENGRWLIAIRLRTKTNKVLSTMYPVDDFVESIVDPVTFLPLRFVKKINEGGTHVDQLTKFDHAARKAVWESFLDERRKELNIQPDTRCIPSMMWWLRKSSFTPGQNKKYELMADEKLYPVEIVPEEYDELDAADLDNVRCVKLEPRASFGGVFVRKGRMWMWVADDERKLALRIQAEVPVGSIKLTLDRVEGPGDDRWVKKKKR